MCSSSATWHLPWLLLRYEGCWDRVLGVDPEAELAIESGVARAGANGGKGSKTAKGNIVETARLRRMQQARRERLPEASLVMADRARGGPIDGKLQIRGDPGSLMML